MQKVIFSAFFCLGALLVRLVLLVLLVHLARRPKQRFKAGNRLKFPPLNPKQ